MASRHANPSMDECGTLQRGEDGLIGGRQRKWRTTLD
jgi:hypothetical protein